MQCWDTAGGSKLVIVHHDLAVRAVAWSPDGRRIVTGSSDKTARSSRDSRTGSELLALRGHDRPVWGVAWSPDGRRLATCSVDQATRIWDTGTGTAIATLTGHDDAIRRVSWSPMTTAGSLPRRTTGPPGSGTPGLGPRSTSCAVTT